MDAIIQQLAKAVATGRVVASAAGLTSAVAKRSTTSKAAMWRAQVDSLVSQAKPPAAPTVQARRGARRVTGD